MQRRDEAEAIRLAGLQRAAPHGAQPTPALPRGAQPSSALPRGAHSSPAPSRGAAPSTVLPHGVHPSPAPLGGAAPSSALPRGAHPSPATSRGAHPSPASPPRAAQSSGSISVNTSALPHLDFTRPPPYRSPPPPAGPRPHRNPTSFVPDRNTSIFWVSESYGVIFLNSDHAYEDAGAHGVQMFHTLDSAAQHSERHSLPGALPHEFPQRGRHRRYISMWSGAVYLDPWDAFRDGGAYGMVAYYGTEQELLDRIASLRAAAQFRNVALYWV
ncbi:hypothetical protein B0H16DRAFT_1732608 [Mycena metata]|uniref:Uncharacterized protein n=1 Tax=Mycena metata TaxID=1033252 RepID=A0AAD7I1H3_9AGAR|nr:hypothetical protein B0H16DRAFT_1732608 [Mycena metata]